MSHFLLHVVNMLHVFGAFLRFLLVPAVFEAIAAANVAFLHRPTRMFPILRSKDFHSNTNSFLLLLVRHLLVEAKHLFLLANIVTTSKALVTSSVALVSTRRKRSNARIQCARFTRTCARTLHLLHPDLQF